MVQPVLERVVAGFADSFRTLDALHLASVEFLRSEGVDLRLAGYDQRMLAAARTLGVPVEPL